MSFNLRPEHQIILEDIRNAKGCPGKTRPGPSPKKGQPPPAAAPADQSAVTDPINSLPTSNGADPSGLCGGSPATAAPVHGVTAAQATSDAPSSPDAELLARLQAADLMTLLGFVNVIEQGLDIMLYYLLGCAYHHGARSGRQILKLLASPPPEFLADDLAMRVLKSPRIKPKKVFSAISKLEGLLNTRLVIDLGEGLPFAGLTEPGEAFWKVVAAYLREYL